MSAATPRLAALAGSNATLLALAALLPLCAALLWWGPLRASLAELEAERARHARAVQVLGARTETLRPLDRDERRRLAGVADDLRRQTVRLGADATIDLVREVARLLETAGVSEVHVSVDPAGGVGASLEVPQLEPSPYQAPSHARGAAFALVPHSVQARGRANFVELRRALQKLHDPRVPARIERASFVRDGFQVQTQLDLVYWTREDRP